MTRIEFLGSSKLQLIDVPDLVPGSGEVVVRTAASAICGSELGTFRGVGMSGGNPGHEAVGTIAVLGEGVDCLKVGDRVGVSAIAGCGSCDYCAAGQYTWCNAFRFFPNMHAEQFTAAANACHPLPDDLDWDVATLLTGDGLGVPYHTSAKIADPAIKTVAVFGLGPIGLGNVLLQSFLGRRVLGVDINPTRRRFAEELGAEAVFDAAADDPVVEQIREATGGIGADVAIEAAGRPETAKQCFPAVRKGGTVVFNGEQPAVELSPSDDFIRRDITAVGAWFYHFCEFPAMLELYRSGLRVGDLISHRFGISEAQEAYRVASEGEAAKALFVYSG
ncbi:MAG: zinc-binding dehydrogenase [Lentisphaerae bacterium]|jgi:threonine dehydrogenase-like Zn-dependent dehydrogenase|nr:zinc-binding dehydrogenase [Lentisphaerota bacterium]MBT4814770.1 zinc-binding dehydrogenase [Lentisphaerota bacterium]MBT5610636.1 zinc-binding dehydrogenase [Lentisphaerota bacterium]MBT7057293.1 zinc-binding dehydrogenase [Lentisphaerota bacterium]MBT7842003.1 zinc-binding dehydrogenase [Lentisphaerota bacterium]